MKGETMSNQITIMNRLDGQFRITDRQFDKLFGRKCYPDVWNDYDEETLEYENVGIVWDMNILNRLRRMGFIKFHEKTGQMVEHWACRWVKAYFVEDVSDYGGFSFRHGDEVIHVTVRYFDGCGSPFVVMGRGETEDEAWDNAYSREGVYV